MSEPSWLPTARALAAVWTGPPLAQFVVSEGLLVYRCLACDQVARWGGLRDKCPHCKSGGRWSRGETEGPPDTVPDLSSSPAGLANMGPLHTALCRTDAHVILRHVLLEADGLHHHVQVGRRHYMGSAHAVHALAIAFVALCLIEEHRERMRDLMAVPR